MYATYHVLLICKNQDDSIKHKWIFDDGLKRETGQEEKPAEKNYEEEEKQTDIEPEILPSPFQFSLYLKSRPHRSDARNTGIPKLYHLRLPLEILISNVKRNKRKNKTREVNKGLLIKQWQRLHYQPISVIEIMPPQWS